MTAMFFLVLSMIFFCVAVIFMVVAWAQFDGPVKIRLNFSYNVSGAIGFILDAIACYLNGAMVLLGACILLTGLFVGGAFFAYKKLSALKKGQ